MSNKIVCSFEIKDMVLMEETLKRIKFDCCKRGNSLVIDAYGIVLESNKISGDSMFKKEISKIKYEYQRDFEIRERALRGETYELSETKDEIIIIVH